MEVQNTQFWAKIAGRAHVVDPGVEHEPRRFFMLFEGRLCQQNSRIPVFVRKLFVYFVIRKEIEHKNVKRQVLEPLPANGSLKKSQPIARQVRFDCLQNLEI